MNTPTPHIEAKYGDFAKTVIMPGDPLRAKFIAETFLEDYKQVNQVRGILGYTGHYKGKLVSVMASGMGIPSMGIYSYELFNFYDVENIIRIGTCGTINPKLDLKDLFFAMGACTDSNYQIQYDLPGQLAPICSFELLDKAVKQARKQGIEPQVGNILSSDIFYSDLPVKDMWKKVGVYAIDMEAAGLYMNALRAGKNALAICTVSDNLLNGTKCTIEERQLSFTEMMKVALEIA